MADTMDDRTIYRRAGKQAEHEGARILIAEDSPLHRALITIQLTMAGYVVEEVGRVVGYFAFLASPEPTYARIYGGRWLDDAQPYHVIHRIAALKATRGIFHTVMDYCALWEKNLRVDTHRDNRVMQHLLLQHGFTYCGIIHLASGDERLAYQRLSSS